MQRSDNRHLQPLADLLEHATVNAQQLPRHLNSFEMLIGAMLRTLKSTTSQYLSNLSLPRKARQVRQGIKFELPTRAKPRMLKSTNSQSLPNPRLFKRVRP